MMILILRLDRMLIKHNVSQMNQTNSIYQVILKNFTNQINNEILNSNHNFRVSLTLDTIANLIDVNSLLGIPNMNINLISLLTKMQKLNQLTINYKLNQQLMKYQKYQGLFTSNLNQQFVALSGTTTSTINLSNFTNANIQWIYFTILYSSFNWVNKRQFF